MRGRELPDGWDAESPDVRRRRERDGQPRLVGQGAQPVAKNIPWLLGGSADLAPSNKTTLNFDEVG